MVEVTQADRDAAAEVSMNLTQMGESRRGDGPDRLAKRRMTRLAEFRAEAREEGRRNPTASCPTCAEAREDGRQEARDQHAMEIESLKRLAAANTDAGRRLERKEVIDWLRTSEDARDPEMQSMPNGYDLARTIERGDHLEEDSDGKEATSS